MPRYSDVRNEGQPATGFSRSEGEGQNMSYFENEEHFLNYIRAIGYYMINVRKGNHEQTIA